MVPGPVQHAAVFALGDQSHVDRQRERYWARLVRMQAILAALDVSVGLPGGGFYVWAPAPGGDAWGFAERLAGDGGVLVSPGEFYGAAGGGHVRIAMVQPLEKLELVVSRLGLGV
jgi:aspartate/methionine/tyrosine aminotransferase